MDDLMRRLGELELVTNALNNTVRLLPWLLALLLKR